MSAPGLPAGFRGVRALVVGDLMLDSYLWGHPTRISPESPVMVVEIDRETHVPGGAANVANNVLALGGHAVVAGVVGDDQEGRELAKQLAMAGAETSAVLTDPGRHTTTKTRLVAKSQQLMRFDRERVEPLGPPVGEELARRCEEAVGESDVVLVSDYSKGVVTPSLAARILAAAAKAGTPVVLNAKPAAAPAFRGVDLVTVNRFEAAAILGRAEVPGVDAARCVMEAMGAKACVVTLGAEGLVWSSGDGGGVVPAVQVEVYDAAGAGDTVATVLAMATARGASLEAASRLAVLAASVVVGKLGVATVSLADLEALV